MPTSPSKKNLSQLDLLIFGGLLVLFFGILGFVSHGKPNALVTAGIATAIALAVSMALNTEQPRRRQLLGLVIPALLLLAGLLPRIDGLNRWAVPCIIWVLGGGAAFAVLTLPAIGRRLYHDWMDAAEPIGWTFSMLILGLVYYGVFTPIGLLLRLLGRDPLERRADPAAKTYWIEHQQPENSERYFRQF